MLSRNPLLLAVTLSLFASPALAAGCFDRTVAVSRYHYVNPGNINNNWQEIYELALANGKVTASTRLSRGAISSPRYDSTSPSYSADGSRIAFLESDSRGANPRLKVMDSTDADNDLEGDNSTVLDMVNVGLTSVAWGPNDRIVYGKEDAAENTQIASATLTGTTLGPIAVHTSGTAFPDGFGFVGENAVVFDADGQSLMHIDLTSNALTTLSGPTPRDRQPSGHGVGADLYFARIVGMTIDLWKGTLNAGPVLAGPVAVLSTADAVEAAPKVSGDGACLAYLSSDQTIPYGPNSDLWIRDLATGETRQITVSRDLGSVTWKP